MNGGRLAPGTCGALTAAAVMWTFTAAATVRACLGTPGAATTAVACAVLAAPFTIAAIRDYKHDRRQP